MKRAALVSACFAFLFVFCLGVSVAQEKATKEECVAKVKEAIALIKEVGLEAAKPKLSDPKGPFVWKDTYIFVQDLDQITLVHPNAKLVGGSMKGVKDSNGKMFTAEMIQIVTTTGEGWVEYMWPKVGEKEPSHKVVYIQRVPGEKIFVGAGVYE